MHQSNETVDTKEPIDPVESALKHAHVIVPVVGAVLMFVMAFIAMLMGAPNGSWS